MRNEKNYAILRIVDAFLHKMTTDKEAYRQTLRNLKEYQHALGLDSDRPSEVISIIPGTESSGRPVGGFLPVYPKEECGTDDEKMAKTLFNLKALLNFQPPKHPHSG